MSEAKMNPMHELSDNVAVPFEQARAMPPSVYTSTEFLEQELDKVFRQDWLCAGRSSSLPNPGDYTTMEIAGEPIMVLRDRDGSLRAQSNVCRHRMSTLLEGRGTVKSIVCPYHAWTYNLDGSLRGAPAMMHNTAFCKSEISLPTIRCEDWKGWIMVALNPDATPVGEGLAEVDALIGHYGMENYVESFCETHRWNTNWKVLAENFMESYHLPVCHAGTIGGTVDLEKMTCPEGRPAFNYHWILKDNTMPLTLAHPNNTHLVGDDRNKTYLLSIYPALLITLTPGYFWYLSLQPDGPDHVNILFGGGLAPEFRDDPEAATHFKALKTLLDEVNDEDRGCTEKVYRGLCAKSAEPGLLSHLERPNFDFARYLNAKIQGEG
ncbi:aromatic ring-hydroxylating oxygenase subunit alpha [Parasedimentitalea huanghaiensis]|uniref:Rieske 2Fe-2S domain-containing protein n=1 Tax=Parasedimentitalea huanghaiensis TaxID=2682100 RepID=A0A6L6WLG2_9RHOB|nr:Rieske 2Fe-2S domain-containing protein [Zongyanglinia huanghaiensis]MVO16797.1 Rieske 2Fe-2S domain-containing protein [Zongyanglinia huanghaiensis]